MSTTLASPPSKPKVPPPPPPPPNGTSGPSGTATPSANAPIAPKYDGIVGSYAVWIGGLPLADFSETSLAYMASPFCIRDLDPGSEIKSYKTRVNDGNHTKFKKLDEDYPLVAFADNCL